MLSLPLSEAQIVYKAQAKLTHNTDHQTSKPFQELISQVTVSLKPKRNKHKTPCSDPQA